MISKPSVLRIRLRRSSKRKEGEKRQRDDISGNGKNDNNSTRSSFSCVPKEWPTWKTPFERCRSASEIAKQKDGEQINTLVGIMELAAEDIMRSFIFEAETDKNQYAAMM